MKLRNSFNSGVRKLANGIYDKLTSEINPKSMARDGLIGILAVGFTLPLSGCLSTYGKSVARDLGYMGMQQAVVSGVRNSVEGPRGTTVNIENLPVNYQPKNPEEAAAISRQRIERAYQLSMANDEKNNYNANRRIVIKRWKDFNGDKTWDKSELLGEISDSINMSNMEFIMYISAADQRVSYTILDSNDNIFLRVDCLHGGFLSQNQKGYFPAGKYTAIARGRNMDLSREFEVTR